MDPVFVNSVMGIHLAGAVQDAANSRSAAGYVNNALMLNNQIDQRLVTMVLISNSVESDDPSQFAGLNTATLIPTTGAHFNPPPATVAKAA